MSDNRGTFVWYDLMTTDVEAAQTFYTGLIGWGTQAWDGPMPYSMWTVGEAPIGGIMDLPEEARKAGAPPHWLAYVGTSDVEATLTQVGKLGGQVLVPTTEVPNAGKFGVFADPAGGVMGVFAAADSTKEPGPTEVPGTISWHEHLAPDLDTAWSFYEKLFGWNKTEAMDMGEQGIYQMYGQEKCTFGGFMNKPAERPGPAAWLYYIVVEDIDAATEKVKATGGSILNGPMDVPGGARVVQCMDPQGAAFALHGK